MIAIVQMLCGFVFLLFKLTGLTDVNYNTVERTTIRSHRRYIENTTKTSVFSFEILACVIFCVTGVLALKKWKSKILITFTILASIASAMVSISYAMLALLYLGSASIFWLVTCLTMFVTLICLGVTACSCDEDEDTFGHLEIVIEEEVGGGKARN